MTNTLQLPVIVKPALAWKLWIYTNYDCNLRCTYCVAKSGPNVPRRAIGLENTKKLIDLQHEHHGLVLSVMHVHLDEQHCIEVLVVRGTSAAVRSVADRLIGTKGVKHGKLTMTTTGKHLS